MGEGLEKRFSNMPTTGGWMLSSYFLTLIKNPKIRGAHIFSHSSAKMCKMFTKKVFCFHLCRSCFLFLKTQWCFLMGISIRNIFLLLVKRHLE